MTENNDEEQNIDDLVDYNDFDSRDFGGKDDMDSFNNDILKFYEDHKKNISAKTDFLKQKTSLMMKILNTEILPHLRHEHGIRENWYDNWIETA